MNNVQQYSTEDIFLAIEKKGEVAEKRKHKFAKHKRNKNINAFEKKYSPVRGLFLHPEEFAEKKNLLARRDFRQCADNINEGVLEFFVPEKYEEPINPTYRSWHAEEVKSFTNKASDLTAQPAMEVADEDIGIYASDYEDDDYTPIYSLPDVAYEGWQNPDDCESFEINSMNHEIGFSQLGSYRDIGIRQTHF